METMTRALRAASPCTEAGVPAPPAQRAARSSTLTLTLTVPLTVPLTLTLTLALAQP